MCEKIAEIKLSLLDQFKAAPQDYKVGDKVDRTLSGRKNA